MLKILVKKKMHISGLARELNISTPVALKHSKILEEAGLIEKELVGNTHVLNIKKEAMVSLEKVWGLVEKPFVIKIKKGETVLTALKKVSGVLVEKKDGFVYVKSVDGKRGDYIFLLNGKMPDKAANQIVLQKDVDIELQKLVPVIGKKIHVKVD